MCTMSMQTVLLNPQCFCNPEDLNVLQYRLVGLIDRHEFEAQVLSLTHGNYRAFTVLQFCLQYQVFRRGVRFPRGVGWKATTSECREGLQTCMPPRNC